MRDKHERHAESIRGWVESMKELLKKGSVPHMEFGREGGEVERLREEVIFGPYNFPV